MRFLFEESKEELIMRDSFKVARWEVKRTLTSKTFLIMTFLVPLIILIIGGVVGYFSAHDSAPDSLTVGVIDKTRLLSKEISREFNNISYTAVFFEDALVNYEQVIKEHDLDGILLIPE